MVEADRGKHPRSEIVSLLNDLAGSRTSSERLQILDALRGVAALSVAWFHLANAAGFTTKGSILFRSGSYGWVGVYPFFVISGFVIPLSLSASGYRVTDYGRFLLKRIVRLDPPYIVSMVVSLVLAGYYASKTGSPFPYSTPQILLHLGYLNVFSRYDWISPIYWTLAVEVQYYLLVGLAFPLLLKPLRFWLLIAPVCVAAAFALRNHGYVFQYLPYFLMGIAAFHYRRGDLGRIAFFCNCDRNECHRLFDLGGNSRSGRTANRLRDRAPVKGTDAVGVSRVNFPLAVPDPCARGKAVRRGGCTPNSGYLPARSCPHRGRRQHCDGMVALQVRGNSIQRVGWPYQVQALRG